MHMFVEQMNENRPCYIPFQKRAANRVTPRLDVLQSLLPDAVTILEHSLKNLQDLAHVALSFALPSYLSPLLPAILNVVTSTVTHEYLQFSFWPAEGLDSPPLLGLGVALQVTFFLPL